MILHLHFIIPHYAVLSCFAGVGSYYAINEQIFYDVHGNAYFNASTMIGADNVLRPTSNIYTSSTAHLNLEPRP
jgi:predicted metalloprotease